MVFENGQRRKKKPTHGFPSLDKQNTDNSVSQCGNVFPSS